MNAAKNEYLSWYKDIEQGLAKRGDSHILMSSSVEEPFDLLHEHLQKNETQFGEFLRTANSWGLPELFDCLSLRYGVPKDNLLPAAGTSNALYLVCRALLEPGDEVVVENPCYQPLTVVPGSIGARIRRFERRPPDFDIDMDSLKQMLNKKTKLLIITNLHNPSGAKTDDNKLREISKLLPRYSPRAHILVDEVYHDFTIDSQAPAFMLGPEFISIGSLTKVYGLGFLRCGWIFARDELISKIREIQLAVEGVGSRVLEAISIIVLENLEQYLRRSREIIAENKPVLFLEIDHLIESGLIQGDLPENGCICFPQVTNLSDTDKLCENLREKHGVFVVPGKFFGAPRHIRIGFGTSPGKFSKAIEQFRIGLLDLIGGQT